MKRERECLEREGGRERDRGSEREGKGEREREGRDKLGVYGHATFIANIFDSVAF